MLVRALWRRLACYLGLLVLGRLDDQRNVKLLVVQLMPMTLISMLHELLAVIPYEDDREIIVEPLLLQMRKEPLELRV